MTPRRFRITYRLGQILYTYTIKARDETAARFGVPQDAEHLNVREIV